MAYLRIYEPLIAFPAAERSAWEAWLTTAAEVPPTLAEEQERSLRGLVAVPPIAVPEAEERVAYVAHLDGSQLICPWQSRLRSWLALTELRAVTRVTDIRPFLPPS